MPIITIWHGDSTIVLDDNVMILFWAGGWRSAITVYVRGPSRDYKRESQPFVSRGQLMRAQIICGFSVLFSCVLNDVWAAAPTVAFPIGERTWSGSGSKSFQFPLETFHDVDRDVLTYTARQANGTSLPSWLRFSGSTRTFSGNPPTGTNKISLMITANDGHDGVVSTTFLLNLTNANDRPTVSNPVSDRVWAGTGTKSYRIPLDTFRDGDGDTLTYSVTRSDGSALPSWLRFAASTRTLSGNPPANTAMLRLKTRANDGHGSTASSYFYLSFDAFTNDAPVVPTPIPALVWSGSGTKSFQIPANTFTDGDGDTLTYSATQASGSALPSWLRFDASTRTFSGNPPAGASSRTIKVMADDGHGGMAYSTFGLTFSGATNDAPRVSNAISDQTWNRNVSQSFQVPATTFSDGDRDSLTYSAKLANGSALPSWLSFSPSTRTFAGTPPTGVTSLDLRVTVNDGHGSTSSDTFSLNFPATTSNHAPVAVNDTVTTTRNQAVMDTLTATDSDADRLTYTIVTNGTKGNATFTNSSTGAFTYTPNTGVTGSDSFTYKVSDGQANSNTATVTVTINPPPNQAPVASNGTLSVAGSTAATGTLSATDAEGDSLTYAIVANGSKGTLTLTNSATGAYRYTPNSGASGTDSFTFRVNDGQANSNVATVTVSISTDYTNSLGMTFKRIPAGTFTMGSPENEFGHEQNEGQRDVTISRSFYMQSTEVTQGQWRTIMGENPSHFSECGESCPVEMVSWNDIQNFISLLNARNEGIYRLPTEAEWEYVARAGTTTAWSFGSSSDSIGDYSWFGYSERLGGNANMTTHPVAQKLPNPWGLYDMHGNVDEWVQDWWELHPAGGIDPLGPDSGSARVLRGGRWMDNPVDLRSASRSNAPPGTINIVGFRIVKTIP
ncbi:MAG: SUMF1/EgtB/PvdO family nonheme iron enzyme [Magnetococcales bacterium]|nr:SUMF1/EgtB/PvdO family nonheme iron enzyme [Magnetococcales bacterium]